MSPRHVVCHRRGRPLEVLLRPPFTPDVTSSSPSHRSWSRHWHCHPHQAQYAAPVSQTQDSSVSSVFTSFQFGIWVSGSLPPERSTSETPSEKATYGTRVPSLVCPLWLSQKLGYSIRSLELGTGKGSLPSKLRCGQANVALLKRCFGHVSVQRPSIATPMLSMRFAGQLQINGKVLAFCGKKWVPE